MPPHLTWRLPTCHLGRSVLIYDSVTSTNDIALTHSVGTAVLAHEQTAGRGQFGRKWDCPPGTAIQLSLTLDPPAELRRPVILTAWAAVTVAELVRQVTDRIPRIKWPNDVLLVGRKVAGILIEQKAVVIVGVGLNVNQSDEQFAAAGLLEACSLAGVAGRSLDRDDVAKRLIAQLDANYEAILNGDLAMLESRWASHVGLLNRSVIVERLDATCHRGSLRELTFDRVAVELEDGTHFSMTPESVRHIR